MEKVQLNQFTNIIREVENIAAGISWVRNYSFRTHQRHQEMVILKDDQQFYSIWPTVVTIKVENVEHKKDISLKQILWSQKEEKQ